MMPIHRLTPTSSRLPARVKGAGFTLIEILAAFVVFALAFGAVMQALSGSIRNTVQARGYTQAALMARSTLDEIEATQELAPGTYSDELENGYRYELDVTEYVPQDEDAPLPSAGGGNITPTVQLLRMEMTVYWGQPPRERQATFTTLRAVQPEL